MAVHQFQPISMVPEKLSYTRYITLRQNAVDTSRFNEGLWSGRNENLPLIIIIWGLKIIMYINEFSKSFSNKQNMNPY